MKKQETRPDPPQPLFEVGEQAVFFTKGWLLGKGIAVIEISRSKREDIAAVKKQIEKAQMVKKERALMERISNADMIVIGSILKVGDHPPRPKSTGIRA
ncbi:MAG: hypothetical protein GXP08_18475 [Gammaproteobacteria bacterium]|nr:hypothetical protein [Gammaproteobacteria bacterium]